MANRITPGKRTGQRIPLISMLNIPDLSVEPAPRPTDAGLLNRRFRTVAPQDSLRAALSLSPQTAARQ